MENHKEKSALYQVGLKIQDEENFFAGKDDNNDFPKSSGNIAIPLFIEMHGSDILDAFFTLGRPFKGNSKRHNLTCFSSFPVLISTYCSQFQVHDHIRHQELQKQDWAAV